MERDHVHTKRAPIFSLHLNAMLHKLPSLFPWKHNKTKVMAEPVLEEVEDVVLMEELHPCNICGRTFLPKPLEKHSRVCEKNATQKRKIFNSLKQRIEGTDLAPFHQQTILKKPETIKPKSPEIKHWKENHKKFVRAIQEAKGSSPPLLTKPRSMSIINNNCERCPSCDRQFGPKAYDRHVEWCKERKARLPQSPANIQQAKERLEARINYKVPIMSKPKKTVREKYQSPIKVDNITAVKSTSCLDRKPSIRKMSSSHVDLQKDGRSRKESPKVDYVPVVKNSNRSPEPRKNKSPEPKSKKPEAIIKNIINKRKPAMKINSPHVNGQLFDMHVSKIDGPASPPRKLVTWKDTVHSTPTRPVTICKRQKEYQEFNVTQLKAVQSETKIPLLNLERTRQLSPLKTNYRTKNKKYDGDKLKRKSDISVRNKKTLKVSDSDITASSPCISTERKQTETIYLEKSVRGKELDKKCNRPSQINGNDDSLDNSCCSNASSPRKRKLMLGLKTRTSPRSEINKKGLKSIKRNVIHLSPISSSTLDIHNNKQVSDVNISNKKSSVLTKIQELTSGENEEMEVSDYRDDFSLSTPSNSSNHDAIALGLEEESVPDRNCLSPAELIPLDKETEHNEILEDASEFGGQSQMDQASVALSCTPRSDIFTPLTSVFIKCSDAVEDVLETPKSHTNFSTDEFEEMENKLARKEEYLKGFKMNEKNEKNFKNKDIMASMQCFQNFCEENGINFDDVKEFFHQNEVLDEQNADDDSLEEIPSPVKSPITIKTFRSARHNEILKKRSTTFNFSDSEASDENNCDKHGETNSNEIKNVITDSDSIVNNDFKCKQDFYEKKFENIKHPKAIKAISYQHVQYEMKQTEKAKELSINKKQFPVKVIDKPLKDKCNHNKYSFVEVKDVNLQVSRSTSNISLKNYETLFNEDKSTASPNVEVVKISTQKEDKSVEANDNSSNFSKNVVIKSKMSSTSNDITNELTQVHYLLDDFNENSDDQIIFESRNYVGNLESFHGLDTDAYTTALSKARLERELRSCCSDINLETHVDVQNYESYSDSNLIKFNRFQEMMKNDYNEEKEGFTSDKILEIGGDEFLSTIKKNQTKELNIQTEKIHEDEVDGVTEIAQISEKSSEVTTFDGKQFAAKIYESCLNENIKRINKMKTDFVQAVPTLKNVTIQGMVEIFEVDEYIRSLREESRSSFNTTEGYSYAEDEFSTSFHSQSTNSLTSARSSNTSEFPKYSPRFLSLINVILDPNFDKNVGGYLKLAKKDCKRLLKANPTKVKKLSDKKNLKLPSIHQEKGKHKNQGYNYITKLPNIENKERRRYLNESQEMSKSDKKKKKLDARDNLMKGFGNYKYRPIDDPFEVAERQLIELLDCDKVHTKIGSPKPSKAKKCPKPITENTKNLVQPPKPLSHTDTFNILEDDFELIENFINDNYNNENLLQSINFDTISLCSNKTMTLNDKDNNYHDEELSIDPLLINEYDNLSIPENFLGEDTSPSESLIQDIKVISKDKTVNNKNIDLNFLPTDKKYKKSIYCPEKKSQSITSSSLRRSSSPQEKKKTIISLKRSTSILDPVKPNTLNTRDEVEAYFETEELPELRSQPPKNRTKVMSPDVPKMEELFAVDDELREEYMKYEQMYLKDREKKLILERAREEEECGRKLCGDSAYGSLIRSKPKVRTRVAKLSPLEPRVDSASSSGSEQSSKQEMNNYKMTKFCHECGNKYPVSTAKFCVECGVRRLVL